VASSSELGRKWFRAIEEHDIEGAMGLLSDEVEFASPGAQFTGSGAARPFLEGYIGGFPDGRFDLRTTLESGDTAAIEGTWIATNTGEMLTPAGPMPPTGRAVSLPFTTVFETDGDRITSHRAYWDQAAFMAQLGLIPEHSA
jgi:steroid delta-isomerase-like uncharacterized protein